MARWSYVDAVRRLLERATNNAFARLTAPDGFWDSAVARIDMPVLFGKRAGIIQGILSSAAFREKLQHKLNKLAEEGARRAAPVVADAVRTIGIENAAAIIKGGPTAATTLLRDRMGPALVNAMIPALGDAMRIANDPILNQAISALAGVQPRRCRPCPGDRGGQRHLVHEIGAAEADIREHPGPDQRSGPERGAEGAVNAGASAASAPLAYSGARNRFGEPPVKFFVDTADTTDIAELAETGLLDGVTTNPSLVHKSGRDFMEVTKEICALVDGPVSAEVVALDHAGMMREAEVLRKIADNVCIKVPLTIDGLKTCKKLTSDGTMVNVTLCFSANQALLAAKARARASFRPFVGRHDDNGFDGMSLIEDIRLIYDNYAFETQLLVASIRHPIHVLQSARIGADVATMPPAVIRGLFKHVLTEKGIEGFLADWAKTGQSI